MREMEKDRRGREKKTNRYGHSERKRDSERKKGRWVESGETLRENRELWPTSVAGLAGRPPVNQRVPGLIPGWGMCLDCWFHPQGR